MKKIYLFLSIIGLGLTNCVDDQRNRTYEAKVDSLSYALLEVKNILTEKDNKIQVLEKQLTELKSSTKKEDKQEFAYPFEEYSDTNYNHHSSIRLIGSIPLKDTLDIEPDHEYIFDHELTLSMIKNHGLSDLFENEREFQKADRRNYGIKIMQICEGESLPLEYENCLSNYYIYLQPYELGYKGKLFKLSSLYAPTLKEIKKEADGFMIQIEHGKFPRKIQKVFISPEDQRIKN